ncbi:GlxA family transcriptional regulator [Thermomonospora cellulosilytica]|uniref:Transcriptional regulator GlxA family with amidase domain n=1 Tax=Thermomonospora cellulosilytica TaxID=1411118 RepID=A0A7W3MYU8_9ACTN|nr:DJ-1/PfpI family protein [Thermomonospora cellulosilytica]MBA9004401.1 transcriptional regulator GlxA family with amidase domain [Thermomonospora cellulosilytica]
MRDVVVLAYDGVRLMDVTGPIEVFGTAARFGAPYRVTLRSPDGEAVTTSTGTRLMVDAEAGTPHTLVVPGAPDLPRLPIPVPGLVDAIRDLAAGARRVASVCTGAFALAEAGLLDGRRATTHWRHTAALARRHPRVAVEPDAIYVRDGRVMTSAGVTAGIDLALAMVEQDEGAGLAREVARDLVVFLQRPGGQSQFSVPARTPRPRNDVLRALLAEIAADPAADHSVPAMALRARVSARHLTRLFHDGVGATPAAYVESVRVEAAQALLEAGETVTGAARRSGLGSDESLRRAFLRRLGVTPSAYRDRFRTTRGAGPTGRGGRRRAGPSAP